MRMLEIFLGYFLQQCKLGIERVSGGAKPDAVADAKYMRVHRDGRDATGAVKPDIRGFTPDTRQGLQRVAVLRNLAAIYIQ